MNFSTVTRFLVAIVLMTALCVAGRSQQPSAPPPNPGAVRPAWAVTVVHHINLQKLISQLEKEQNVRIGSIGIADPVNISTGLLLDQNGHVLTRLGNVDPRDKTENVSVITRDGASHVATLVGVDLASGFALLEVSELKGTVPALTAATPFAGSAVRILSTDVHPQPDKSLREILIFPSFKVDNATVGAASFYSQVRGALILKSEDLGPRCDSGIITTPDFEVVGVAQAGSVAMGTAYLFPLEFLKDSIVKRLLEKNQSIPAGWLGVSGVTTAQLPESEQAPLGSQTGVVVKEIVAHSAAESAGIHLNDVIVGMDGFSIKEVNDMSAVLSACPAGEKVHIQEIRQGKAIELDAVLGARDMQPALAAALVPQDQSIPGYDGQGQSVNPLSPLEYASSHSEETISAGFTARDLTSQLARYFGAESGTLVTSVAAGSQADRAGLKAGDVIISSTPGQVFKAHQLKSILASSGAVALRVIRNKKPLAIEIRTDSAPSR